MSAYLQSLNRAIDRDSAAQAAAAAAAREAGSRASRERLTPLEDRLAKLLATIPGDVQREGLSLPMLVPLLRGRRFPTANPGQLGIALRKNGWRRVRKWRGGEIGFKALWYPPAAA